MTAALPAPGSNAVVGPANFVGVTMYASAFALAVAFKALLEALFSLEAEDELLPPPEVPHAVRSTAEATSAAPIAASLRFIMNRVSSSGRGWRVAPPRRLTT
jgi:hypothetical protein